MKKVRSSTQTHTPPILRPLHNHFGDHYQLFGHPSGGSERARFNGKILNCLSLLGRVWRQGCAWRLD
ncbi:MAG: hypothetical protein JSV60_08310, partial [Desulfobacterales bacterium]